MKYLYKLGLVTLLSLLNNMANAVNPQDEWYAGITIGATQTRNYTYKFYDPLVKKTFNTTLYHKIGGDFAGALGYRCENLRAEFELMITDNPYNKISGGGVTINSKKTPGTYSIKGETYVGAGMINVYYDFFTPGEANSDWAPYIGAGLGYAAVKNIIHLDYNISPGVPQIQIYSYSNHVNGTALQGILGISYFLDDFMAVSLDYRYFTTKKMGFPVNGHAQINMINLSFVGSLDFSQ